MAERGSHGLAGAFAESALDRAKSRLFRDLRLLRALREDAIYDAGEANRMAADRYAQYVDECSARGRTRPDP
jgi:hypothetical protein